MANIIGEAAYRVTADTSGFRRSAESGVGSAMRTIGRSGLIAAGAGIGAAFIGMGVAVKRGFDEFADSQRVMAQTQAVLKSTGGAAGVTAKQITTLSENLSRLTGIDDETIQASENLLLTFTSVRDYVDGKFIGTFTDATETIADVATAMASRGGGEIDLQSATLQVGKALQDPVRGMTALRRVGVNFSEAQEKVIKHLVDTGKTAEAQRLILKELHKEFGGSAIAAGETLPGAMNKLKNSFDEAMGSMVATAAPALESIIGGLTRFSEFLQGVFAHEKLSVRLNLLWEGVSSVASDLWDAFVRAWEGEQGGAGKPIMVNGRNIGFEGEPPTEGLRQRIIDAFDAVDWEAIGERMSNGIKNGFSVSMGAIDWGSVGRVSMELFIAGWEAQLPLIQAILFDLPMALIEGTIEAIAGIDWGALSDSIDEAMTGARIGFEDWLQEQIGSVDWVGIGSTLVGGLAAGIAGAAGLMGGAGQSLVSKFLQPWQLINFGAVLGKVGELVSGIISRLSPLAGRAAGFVGNMVSGMISRVSGLPGQIGGVISNMVSTVLSKLSGLVGSAGSAAGNIVSRIANAFTGIAGKVIGKIGDLGLPGKLSGIASSALGWAAGIGRSITDGVKNGLGDLKGAVEDWVSDAVSDLNPFSPVEHGGAKYIGEPLMAGAIAGIESLTPALNAAIRAATPGLSGASGTVDGGTTNNRTINVGQVVLPTVTNGGDLVRQLDALVARPG